MVVPSLAVESSRSKRRLFEDEDEDEPSTPQQPHKSQKLDLAGFPSSSSPVHKIRPLVTSRASFSAPRQLHQHPGQRRAVRAKPVFKVPFPKQALPIDPKLALISTTYLRRKTPPAPIDPPSPTPADDLQVVPSVLAEVPASPTPQEVPLGLLPRPPKKPRLAFRSPVLTTTKGPADPGSPSPSPSPSASAPAAHHNQHPRLFSVAIRSATAKKGTTPTPVCLSPLFFCPFFVVKPILPSLVLVVNAAKWVLVRESVDKLANLRRLHNHAPYIVRDDRVHHFPAQPDVSLDGESGEDLLLGDWRVVISEEVLMPDFVFRDGKISFASMPVLPLNSVNIGFRLLQKMGWAGGCLGRFFSLTPLFGGSFPHPASFFSARFPPFI